VAEKLDTLDKSILFHGELLKDEADQRLKRALDVCLGLAGIFFACPLILITGCILWIDSKGRFFFEQERIGKNGRGFKMLKFATMSANEKNLLSDHFQKYPQAQKEWDQTHKLRNDPRITRIGKILRATSLDELPQLINVVKGEMSLVGPRPILPEEIDQYTDRFDLYKTVRPGLTGLWQVSGRNKKTFLERVELDEYYIKKWSIRLDLLILFRTIWVVIRRDGAY